MNRRASDHRPLMVVKVGSQVLCGADGALSLPALEGLADQIARLREQDWRVLLVSSGAVAAGSGTLGQRRLANPVTRRQVQAAVGQLRLMETWRRLFGAHDIAVAQVLASKSDFQSRGHYLNMRGCIEGLLDAGLLPIANENDVVSVTELMFTDNDELAGLLATMLDADHLCLLSTVGGVLDGDGQVIERWDDDQHKIADLVRSGTSQLGRGGMHNKLTVAHRTASLGVAVTIADGCEPGVLERIAEGSDTGTRFEPLRTETRARRWVASMADHTLGSVTVNTGAEAALLDRQRLASLLPVGVESVAGDFCRGDVIEVRGADGKLLGCGRAQYDRDEAERTIGQRDQRPIIHYDYLYLID